LVTLGEIAVEECEPVVFGSGSGGGVLEEAADGELSEHFVLDAAEHLGEVDFAGVEGAGHRGPLLRLKSRKGDVAGGGGCRGSA
jgi:hypothetical protein